MLKYHSTYIGFREIPDEISLCINLTNCPNNCKGCHSPWLKEDSGTPLTYIELKRLIKDNKGITCVCFMGGDKEPWEIKRLASHIKEETNLKTAWYSGKDYLMNLSVNTTLDYVKIGPYIEEFGPLDSKTTNQQLFKFDWKTCTLDNITYKFWKND